jgi:hypothetical protein
MKFLFNKKKNKILGGHKKRSPSIKTDRMGLSKETKKKVEERMIKNFIKNAREKGGL